MLGVGDIVLRLGIAALFGALVGLERERRVRSAGIRTMALVGLGSALFTVASMYPFDSVAGAQRGGVDATRIMAQIVTGIGFLGAGTIWLRKDVVRGLTTAAALWVVAAVGIACGAGQWTVAIAATAVMILVLLGLLPIEQFIFPTHGGRTIRIWAGTDATAEVMAQAQEICRRAGLTIDSLTLAQSKRGGDVITLAARARDLRQMSGAL
ncbi:MAG TPA: MgtC/SapB family protein, partial [Ktedonobacterales bacterium]|nr:MgtC/SapB family protein [Ktedonobacterales bacterium]